MVPTPPSSMAVLVHGQIMDLQLFPLQGPLQAVILVGHAVTHVLLPFDGGLFNDQEAAGN